MVDMSRINTFYKPTSTQSLIDKDAAMASYVKRNRLLMDTMDSLRNMTERAIYIPADRKNIGNCIMQQLVVLAKADALLGNLDDNDYKGRRQAILIGVFETRSFTDAYSIALQTGATTTDQRKLVEGWFSHLSEAFITEFTPPAEPRPRQDRWLDNNGNTHYWAGVAIGFLAVHSGDGDKFAWAMRVLHEGLGEVDADGGFPLELSRGGTRAALSEPCPLGSHNPGGTSRSQWSRAATGRSRSTGPGGTVCGRYVRKAANSFPPPWL